MTNCDIWEYPEMVTMEIAATWNDTPCSLINRYHEFQKTVLCNMKDLTRNPRNISNPVLIAIGMESELFLKCIPNCGSTEIPSCS
jgi:hypothetical protein